MVLIISFLIFLGTIKNESFLWLILPLGLLLDFWEAKPLGYSGLETLALVAVFQAIFGGYLGSRQKIKV